MKVRTNLKAGDGTTPPPEEDGRVRITVGNHPPPQNQTP
jgi:hypothetical protein